MISGNTCAWFAGLSITRQKACRKKVSRRVPGGKIFPRTGYALNAGQARKISRWSRSDAAVSVFLTKLVLKAITRVVSRFDRVVTVMKGSGGARL